MRKLKSKSMIPDTWNYDYDTLLQEDEKRKQQVERLKGYGSYSDFLHRRTEELLDDMSDAELNDATVAEYIISELNSDISLQKTRSIGQKWRYLNRLEPGQIAQILHRRHHFANVSRLNDISNDEHPVLMRFDTDSGLYTSDMIPIRKSITEMLAFSITNGGIYRTIEEILSATSPIVSRNTDKNLVPVGNGIFNTKTGKLEDYSPDRVFLCKTPIDYHEDATDVDIDGWSLESWLDSLSDDVEVRKLLREILSAVIRSKTWNKAVWLVNSSGSNGKSSYIKLLQWVVGSGNFASLSVDDFNSPYSCGNLMTKLCVISEETNSSTFVDKVSTYKAACTGSVIHSDIKYQNPVDLIFNGLIVQAINGYPKTSDKTNSFYRRLLLVPFEKTFTGEGDNKNIREDYIQRPEVLQYALKIALENNISVVPV